MISIFSIPINHSRVASKVIKTTLALKESHLAELIDALTPPIKPSSVVIFVGRSRLQKP